MTIEEFCENNPPLTDEEKDIYDVLCKRGWIDVAEAYG